VEGWIGDNLEPFATQYKQILGRQRNGSLERCR